MKIYQCKFFYFDNDDPAGCGGKWEWCQSPIMRTGDCMRNCICTEHNVKSFYYAQKYCCGYKRGKLLGETEITDRDRAEGRFIKEKSKEEIRKFYNLTGCWQ